MFGHRYLPSLFRQRLYISLHDKINTFCAPAVGTLLDECTRTMWHGPRSYVYYCAVRLFDMFNPVSPVLLCCLGYMCPFTGSIVRLTGRIDRICQNCIRIRCSNIALLSIEDLRRLFVMLTTNEI